MADILKLFFFPRIFSSTSLTSFFSKSNMVNIFSHNISWWRVFCHNPGLISGCCYTNTNFRCTLPHYLGKMTNCTTSTCFSFTSFIIVTVFFTIPNAKQFSLLNKDFLNLASCMWSSNYMYLLQWQIIVSNFLIIPHEKKLGDVNIILNMKERK